MTAGNVDHILGIKRIRAGQTRVSVDHVQIPRAKLDDFVALTKESMDTDAPAFSSSSDATELLTERHIDRILDMIEESRVAGATVVTLDADGVADRGERRVPLTLLIDPAASTRWLARRSPVRSCCGVLRRHGRCPAPDRRR